MPEADPSSQPFYLIVTDHDRGVFAVEGPMTDDRPWNEAATYARNHQHRIVCGPTGADRDDLAAEYRRTHKGFPDTADEIRRSAMQLGARKAEAQLSREIAAWVRTRRALRKARLAA